MAANPWVKFKSRPAGIGHQLGRRERGVKRSGSVLLADRFIFIFNSMDLKHPPHRLNSAQKVSRTTTTPLWRGIDELHSQSTESSETEYLTSRASNREIKEALNSRGVAPEHRRPCAHA